MDDASFGASVSIDTEARSHLPRTTEGIFGLLDFVSVDMIEGWALDPAAADASVEIMVMVDGARVWTGRADIFRSDLAAVGVGNGCHAFRCAVNPEWLAAPISEHEVRAFTIAGTELPGSPLGLRVPEMPVATDPAREAVATAAPPEAPATPPDRTAGMVGCLDSIDDTLIRGWAYNARMPTVPVSVDLFEGDVLLGRVNADQYRADLENGGIGDGRHAFLLPTPLRLRDGRSHMVEALVSNTSHRLRRSPLQVSLAAPSTASVVADLETKVAGLSQALADLRRTLLAPRDVPAAPPRVEPYEIWRARFGVIGARDRTRLRAVSARLTTRPRFSVVMPVFRTQPEYLKAAIASVKEQIYPEWELCIADDGSGVETAELLDELIAGDDRIRVVRRPANGGIAAATISALQLAQGDYVCFLDHDDTLTEDALLQFAYVIARDQPDILYSDEDKLDDDGRVHTPHFKPDFSYSLLLGYNYLCHLLAIRRELIERTGAFDSRFDGAQDHDCVLRCMEQTHPSRIAHVPLVLYHWRAHAGSTATSLATKSYAGAAGRDAVADHLRRVGQDATVIGGPGLSYRVIWPLPAERPLVSIVIPTRDQARSLAGCLAGLFKLTAYGPFEVIIVDNGSVEPETHALFGEAARDSRVRVVRFDQEFNFSAICNFGATHASGSLLLLLNDDVEVIEGDWLTEMVRQASRPNVGAVGAKLLYPDGRIQHAGVILGIGGVAGHSHKYLHGGSAGYMNRLNIVQEMSACTAACLLVQRAAFDAIGGFDAMNLPVAFNDVDFCLRLRESGYDVVFTPHAVLRHHESLSRGAEDSPAKALRSGREIDYMLRRWAGLLTADPFYSPNLTLVTEDFAIDPDRGTSRLPTQHPD